MRSRERGALRRFMPFDVCLPFVATPPARLRRDYPGLDVHAIVGDFTNTFASCRGALAAGR